MGFSPRIAFIDLTFNWPPVGGCWVDAHHVMKGLQGRGAAVKLFCPDFQEYYPRGSIKEKLPYPVQHIPFNRYTYRGSVVQKRFRKAIDAFQADMVFVMDGYHMKNHVISAVGAERCFLRFYAYELLCVNLHYYRYHEAKNCDQGYFENPRECQKCWFRRMPPWGRAAQILLGMKEVHPKLHFSQEYLFSGAHTNAYRNQLFENFNNLAGAIVYNDFMKEKIAPYVSDIHVFPSGVDASAFAPSLREPGPDKPVKIFLPGRANDPLKGLNDLIHAGQTLAKQGLGFEVHYTAAMDCPTEEPWLINRGWVNQAQLAELYREMDIVAAPSQWVEPFGITALEGMACGLPVVASKIGGLAHTVVDGETGYHSIPEDGDSLARALEPLIRDAGLRRRLGENARRRVETHYDWNVLLDANYMPLIESFLTKRPSKL